MKVVASIVVVGTADCVDTVDLVDSVGWVDMVARSCCRLADIEAEEKSSDDTQAAVAPALGRTEADDTEVVDRFVASGSGHNIAAVVGSELDFDLFAECESRMGSP